MSVYHDVRYGSNEVISMEIQELKKRKKELKITTADLAILADLPVSTVSKIMTGETKNPSYTTIEKLDNALLQEEMRKRIQAYREAIKKYYDGVEHGDNKILDYKEFEKKYREDYHLNDAPIPYATRINSNGKRLSNDITGNIVKKNDIRMTTNDLEVLSDDKFIELIDGDVIIGQAPNVKHQLLVQNIGKAIDKYIDDNDGNCKMFNVGINVQTDEDDYTLLIPDIVILCDDSKLNDKGIFGAPDLVMEVVSERTRRIDYNDKMHKYMRSGVREYWIVDPNKERVTVYIAGEPMLAYVYSFTDKIPVEIYDGKLEIQMDKMV